MEKEQEIKKITSNKNQINILNPKFFREIENKKKLDFIINNSDINQKIIIKAQRLSNLNGYHNFGHELGTSESAILIAIAEGLSRNEINLLALVGLFHDAGHLGIPTPYDEEKSYELTMKSLIQKELDSLLCTAEDIKKLILATKFSLRGKLKGKLEKIIQDADLGCMGYGPHYILYSTMGVIDEEKTSIDAYMTEEYKFINQLQKINPNIFLSEGAKQIFISPLKSLKTLSKRPQEVLIYAYDQRYQNISFEKFSKNINEIIAKYK